MSTKDEPHLAESLDAVPSSLSGSCADSDALIQQLHSSKGSTRERARKPWPALACALLPLF